MPGTELVTCLWFDNQGEEAADFYLSVFRDGKRGRTTRYTEAGPGPAGAAMTVEFEVNGHRFVALNGGPEYTFTPAISFQIMCADQAEVDYYWDRLSEGGQEVACGWVTDKYGLSWQVVPSILASLVAGPDPEKAARTTRAMLQMVKLDIAALQRAHAGE